MSLPAHRRRRQCSWGLATFLLSEYVKQPPHPYSKFHVANLFNSDFPGGSDGKASAYNAGDLGSIPGSGRSPGEGNRTPLQYSWLENPMDGEAWWTTVHGVAKSRTWLSDFTFFHFKLGFCHLQQERFLKPYGRQQGDKGTRKRTEFQRGADMKKKECNR